MLEGSARPPSFLPSPSWKWQKTVESVVAFARLRFLFVAIHESWERNEEKERGSLVFGGSLRVALSLSFLLPFFRGRDREDGRKKLLRVFFPSFSPLPPFFRLFRILSKVRSADDKCARPAELCLFWEGRVCLNGRGAERWDLTKEEWPRAKRERHVPSTFLPLSKKLEQVGTSARVITSQHCCFYDRLRNSTDFTFRGKIQFEE